MFSVLCCISDMSDFRLLSIISQISRDFDGGKLGVIIACLTIGCEECKMLNSRCNGKGGASKVALVSSSSFFLPNPSKCSNQGSFYV
jgi:hypothetical protein